MRTIVYGFPRSGTTALIKALDAGGIPAFYQAGPNDSNNPGGSWEVSGQYTTRPEYPYIPETDGKCFKMFISPESTARITGQEPTHVIFVMRKPLEIAASFERLGHRADKLKEAGYYENIINETVTTLFYRPGVTIDCVTFQQLLTRPNETFEWVREYGADINPAAAATAVTPEVSAEWQQSQGT